MPPNLRVTAGLLGLLLVSAPVGAAADEPRSAEQLFEQGVAAYDRGDLETALDLFRQSHAAGGGPFVLYNVAVTAHRLDRPAEALRAFRRYLSEADGVEAAQRARIQETLAELEREVAELELEASPEEEAADVGVDETSEGVDEADVGVDEASEGEADDAAPMSGARDMTAPAVPSPAAAARASPVPDERSGMGVPDATGEQDPSPLWRSPWFWVVTAGVVVAGATAAAAVVQRRADDPLRGNLEGARTVTALGQVGSTKGQP